MRGIIGWTASLALAAAMIATPAPVRAQTVSWQAWIGGVPLNCVNWQGRQVAIISNPYLDNVGVAHATQDGQPVIQLNPYVMNQFSPLVQVWWFAHECGHHALRPNQNSESAADCWGIRVMRNQRLIWDRQQLQAFAYELQNLPGSPSGHLPGPLRAQNIAYCALT